MNRVDLIQALDTLEKDGKENRHTPVTDWVREHTIGAQALNTPEMALLLQMLWEVHCHDC